MNIPKASLIGFQIGLGVALVPVTVTSLIACSKIIAINIIAEVAIRILTANTYSLSIHGISFVSVPVLWKISRVSAITGGTICAISIIANLTHLLYQYKFGSKV